MFQSTRPARGATPDHGYERRLAVFQSTRPARGATVQARNICRPGCKVSIHAPRAGRDTLDGPYSQIVAESSFNPRAPRGARRASPVGTMHRRHSFNPRAPRGARLYSHARNQPQRRCFNPRAPRGARPGAYRRFELSSRVSIHAPRAGRDVARAVRCTVVAAFQSTRPARGATTHRTARCWNELCFNPRAPRGARPSIEWATQTSAAVSIHAPRAGRDRTTHRPSATEPCFNPRAPRGARRQCTDAVAAASRMFQSTRPARGATGRAMVASDVPIAFQSTRPARGATRRIDSAWLHLRVSIHAPRAGRDRIRLNG